MQCGSQADELQLHRAPAGEAALGQSDESDPLCGLLKERLFDAGACSI